MIIRQTYYQPDSRFVILQRIKDFKIHSTERTKLNKEALITHNNRRWYMTGWYHDQISMKNPETAYYIARLNKC